MGAERVIDYTKNDFTQETDQFDFIFDAVGKSSFSKCKHLLKPQGLYSSSEPNLFMALFTSIMGGKKELFSSLPNIKEDLKFIKNLIDKGSFKPVIDRKYPLEDITEAYKYVETGQKIGNVVLFMDKS